MNSTSLETVALTRKWLRSTNGKLAAGAVALFVAYLVWLFFGGPAHRVLIANLANLPFELAGAASALLAARHRALSPRVRRAWMFVGLAMATDGVGNIMWLIYENVFGLSPETSWADAVYICYYPLMLVGLLTFPTARRTRGELAKLWLDAGTVMLAGGIVIWHIIFAPALRAEHAGTLEALLSIAYPVGDLALLYGSATLMLRMSSSVSRGPVRMLAVAGVLFFLADVVYGYQVLQDNSYTSGTWVDIGWQAPGLLWFLAAQFQRWHASAAPEQRVQVEETRAGVSVLPYGAIAVGYVLLFVVARPYWSEQLGSVMIAVVVLTAAVVARQIAAAWENTRLLADRAAREARFRSLVQHSSDVIMVVDDTGVVRYMSPAVQQVLGWAPDSALGRRLVDLVHEDDGAVVAKLFADIGRQAGATATGIFRVRHAQGDWRHIETVGTGLLDDPTIRGIVLNTRDVSERTLLEAELTHQAYHDPLTGLVNRGRFRSLVEQALEHAGTERASVAVLYLDLDGFKNVNDSLGHSDGDQMLVETAVRLRNATRGGDTVARLGGDEFALLLEQVQTDSDAIIIADRVVNAMKRPFKLRGGEIVAGASVGIARGDANATADDLLRNADVAMYVGKRGQKGQYMVFRPEMYAAVRDRLTLETELRRDIERGNLTLAFQPIIDIETERVAGVEALVRWPHEERGLLPPNEFIPLAESTGLIVPLGRWVLREACRLGASWRMMLPTGSSFTVAVNISGHQLTNPELTDDLVGALEQSGLPPSFLMLEITESTVARDGDAALARLRALKSLGIQLAIDDFGMGYSSLSSLERFPIDVLKIDKSFVGHVGADESRRSLARMIVALGDALSLRTIAEGVERPEQAAALSSMGCSHAQGYYYSRPVTPAEITLMIQRGHFAAPSAGRRRNDLLSGEYASVARSA
ncbi:MAG TPA: EAL domain-containing protein [Gemmatimonadaceae bacterium]|nr:EAL domain-containing protein [Gemmatimonadaceae bacterium]